MSSHVFFHSRMIGSSADALSRPLDMRTYTLIEKDGEQYISRSYTSDKDSPSISLKPETLDDTSEYLPSSLEKTLEFLPDDDDREEPFRERSIVVSSPTREESKMDSQEDVCKDSENSNHSLSAPQRENVMGTSPSDEVCYLIDAPIYKADSSPTASQDDPLQLELLLLDPVRSYLLPVSDQSHDLTPNSSPQSRQTSFTRLNDNKDEDLLTLSPPPLPISAEEKDVPPVTSSSDSSPRKVMRKSRDADSLMSCDTDEWIDNQLERDLDSLQLGEGNRGGTGEPIEEEGVANEGEEGEKEEDVDGFGKWLKGMSKEVEWSPEGLPLMKFALISRRSRHRAGKYSINAPLVITEG